MNIYEDVNQILSIEVEDSASGGKELCLYMKHFESDKVEGISFISKEEALEFASALAKGIDEVWP